MPNPSGFHNADGQAGRLESPDDGLFITPGGFTNHMGRRIPAQQFKQLRMAFGLVGEGVSFSGQVQL